jgi:hypothetical protein
METPRGDTPRSDENGALDSSDSSDAARRLNQAATGAINTAKDKANEALSKGAETVERSTQSAASALRSASEQCQEENAWLGMALRKSADGLERASNALAGGDMHRVFDDVNGFARRQPALFLGISLALGFAAARVSKTAIERANGGPSDSDPYRNTDSFGAM